VLHICSILFPVPMNDQRNFCLEHCFTIFNRRVFISEKSDIPLCPNTPTHDYNEFHRKWHLELSFNMAYCPLCGINLEGTYNPISSQHFFFAKGHLKNRCASFSSLNKAHKYRILVACFPF
jgi:hypothetical protein